MRIRLIIYAFIIALALDVGLNDGRYLKMALRSAQYGGDHVGVEVDNGISQRIPKVPGLRPNAWREGRGSPPVSPKPNRSAWRGSASNG
jgi:hypothetical protein